MSYVKIWVVFLIILLIIWGGFYLNVVWSVTTLVSGANTNFIALLPLEAKAFVAILMFSLLIWLAFAIIRE